MIGFEKLFFETTDDTIRRIFGASTSELIYKVMERHISLRREEIGNKIEVFYTYLERLLGFERAQVIQAASLKRLCLKLQREYEEVEKYLLVLDELCETKLKLLAACLKEDSSVCN